MQASLTIARNDAAVLSNCVASDRCSLSQPTSRSAAFRHRYWSRSRTGRRPRRRRLAPARSFRDRARAGRRRNGLPTLDHGDRTRSLGAPERLDEAADGHSGGGVDGAATADPLEVGACRDSVCDPGRPVQRRDDTGTEPSGCRNGWCEGARVRPRSVIPPPSGRPSLAVKSLYPYLQPYWTALPPTPLAGTAPAPTPRGATHGSVRG